MPEHSDQPHSGSVDAKPGMISDPPLRFSDPEWPERLARGAKLVVWGVVAVVVLGFGGIVVIGERILPPLVMMGAGLLWLYGGWLVTTPEPGGAQRQRYGALIRVALVIGWGRGLVYLLMHLLDRASGLSETIMTPLIVVAAVATLIGLGGFIALVRCVEKVALRIRIAMYANEPRRIRYAFGVSAAVAIVGEAIGRIAIWEGWSDDAGILGLAFGVILSLAALGAMASGSMILRKLSEMADALQQQAELAKRSATD